jgi:hypothetical protein
MTSKSNGNSKGKNTKADPYGMTNKKSNGKGKDKGKGKGKGNLFRWCEGVEECAGFGEDVFGFGGGEGPAEDALWGELGSALGVAAD